MSTRPRHGQGFSLVEMSIVLLVISLLAKSAVGPLAALQEHEKRQQAQRQLQQIHEVITAHVVAYGALPCPLEKNSHGILVEAGSSINISTVNQAAICRVSNGFVNAHALRIGGEVNDHGALLDPWGREYHFAISLDSTDTSSESSIPYWTTPGAAAGVGLGKLSADIVLCNVQTRLDCSGQSVRSDQIAYVVFSTAADDSGQGFQAENLDGDRYFVFMQESIVTGRQFDDLMIWSSAADISYWMLRMGWLP